MRPTWSAKPSAVSTSRSRKGASRCSSATFRASFPAETFDRVLTINTIYFWPDALQGLSEILRVLKKEGRAAVSIRSKEKMEKVAAAVTKHGFRLFSPDEVAALMRQAGFRDVRVDHRDQDKFPDQAIILGTRCP